MYVWVRVVIARSWSETRAKPVTCNNTKSQAPGCRQCSMKCSDELETTIGDFNEMPVLAHRSESGWVAKTYRPTQGGIQEHETWGVVSSWMPSSAQRSLNRIDRPSIRARRGDHRLFHWRKNHLASVVVHLCEIRRDPRRYIVRLGVIRA